MTREAVSDPPWILGIASSHNGAACLLRGDEIVVAIQEERLLRCKRARVRAAFPSLSVPYCLDHAGITPSELSLVVVCGQCATDDPYEQAALNPWFYSACRDVPLVSISHHFGHATSAFATSGFDEAAILVVDGAGSPHEDLSPAEQATVLDPLARGMEIISLYRGSPAAIVAIEKHECASWLQGGTEHARMPRFGSLGGLYGAAGVQIFGSATDGAGKVMGLAPYGKATIPVRDFFEIVDGRFVFSERVLRRFRHGDRWPDHPRAYARLAASAQAALEEALLYLARRLYDLTGCKKLCYAGGVALNSVANERLVRETPFDEVFVLPAAEDSGTAIGAAHHGLWLLTGSNAGKKLGSDAVGRAYSVAEIDRAIAGTPAVRVQPATDVLGEVVNLLCEGKIVGWFDGRSELGPRALGQRSILCDPRRLDAKETLNLRVKQREAFRPFAPAVLLEQAHEWFELGNAPAESPFMLRVAPFRKDRAARVPAVVHADGTGRLQTLTARDNGRFHGLVVRFFARTGVPILLNTSFNVANEPIVETPEDALFCLLFSGLDCCVLGDRIVHKSAGFSSIVDLRVSVTADFVAVSRDLPGGPLDWGPELWKTSPYLRSPVGIARAAEHVLDAEIARLGEPYVTLRVRTPWGGASYFMDPRVLSVLRLADGQTTGRQMLARLESEPNNTIDEAALLLLLCHLRRARAIELGEVEKVGEAETPRAAPRSARRKAVKRGALR
jgi:carbamoyltransferase